LCERYLAFAGDDIIHNAGSQTLVRVAGGVSAAEYDTEAWMRLFEPGCFRNGLRELTSHAPDANGPDTAFVNYAIDVWVVSSKTASTMIASCPRSRSQAAK
jgi:hypothetical protein